LAVVEVIDAIEDRFPCRLFRRAGDGRRCIPWTSWTCQEAIDTRVEPVDEAMQVRTPGVVFSVRWDERGSATALGQMALFAEYLVLRTA
jgi:hypothetical protein